MAVAGLSCVAGAVLAVPSAPAAGAALLYCSGAGTHDDFDHDGKDDFAVGVPGEDLDGVVDAGRVEVHYGDGAIQSLRLPFPEKGDRFGVSLMPFALDTGPCDGLLVGAPGATVGTRVGAGLVGVFRHPVGDPSGRLAYHGQLDQVGLGEGAQTGAGFGTALALPYLLATDTGTRWSSTVYVGEPGRSVGGHDDAGAVSRVTLTADTDGVIGVSSDPLLTEESAEFGGAAGTGDRFGTSIGESGTIIGAPGATVDGRAEAGKVYVRVMGGYRAFTQNTAGVPGTAEAGDRFGAAVLTNALDHVIGAPGESIGAAAGAGSVTYLTDPDATHPAHARLYYQGKDGMPGTPERGDGFGAALGTERSPAFLIGVPGEDIGSARNAGLVQLRYTATWSEDTPGVAGAVQAGDRFGASFGLAGTHLLVGAPGEHAGAGLVIDGLPTDFGSGTSVVVHQESGSAEAGDGFGAGLPSGPFA